MIPELEMLGRLFGPRKFWYIQSGDGKHLTGNHRFTSLEELSEWMKKNSPAATYYEVQIGSIETETRPTFDEIETIVAFPIDVDPATETRPSTEKERVACFEVADKISDGFEQRGLGRPIRGDSGNGAQLFLRLRVDVTDPKQKVYWYDLFRRVQGWVKKEFADPRVQIDSVADFARIMALPGSMKRKVIGVEGPSDERPFRKVEFLDEGQATDERKFEAFASSLPMVETSANEDVQFKLVELNQDILNGLPPKVVALAQSWDEPQTDQSESAFAIAAELYSQGWNLDIIYTLLHELYAKHPKESKRTRAAELAARALRAAMIPSNERIREAYLHAPKRTEGKTASVFKGLVTKQSEKDEATIKVNLEKPVLPPGIPDTTLGPLKGHYEMNDPGNGERMLERFGRYAKHLDEADSKGWMVFRECKWEPDPNRAELRKLSVAMARFIPIHESLGMENETQQKELEGHRRRSLTTGGINNSITEFGSHVRGSISEFDRNPSLFNVKNGTLVIEGASIYKKEPHDPDDLLTRVAGTYYDPNAKAPKWEAFLEKNLPDIEVREWLRRYCGSMLFGSTREKAFAIIWGETNTGKTVFKEVILGILNEYGAVTKWQTFEDDLNADLAQRELARFRGMRGIFAAENSKDSELNVQLIKELTGMDTTSAREIFKATFQYKPSYKFLLVGNNLPVVPVKESDEAIWDRIQIVPFTVVIPKSERISHYHEVLLREEGPGILNWLIGGLKDWLGNGLPPAKRMDEAKKEMKQKNNPVIQFANECCDFGPNLSMNYATLKISYDQWAQRTGNQKFDSGQAMGRRIAAIPGISARNDADGNRIYKGIALKNIRSLEIVSKGENGPKTDDNGRSSGFFPIETVSHENITEKRQLSSVRQFEVPVGQQLTLEQAEPALKESVDAAIAVQAKVAEARGDEKKYEAASRSESVAYNIAAFDLETVNLDISDPNNRILTIGFAGSDGFAESWAFDDERETIKAFVQKAQEYTCLLGWNTDKFDLPMLRARVEGWDDSVIPPVLDALRAHKLLLRKGETKFQLDYIAKKHLGRGKLDFDPTRTKQYFDDPAGREKLREYNKRDAQLVLDLNAVMGYFDTFEAIVDEASFDSVGDGASQWMRSRDGLRREFAAMSKNKADNGFVWWRPIMGLIEHYCQRNSMENPFDWPSDSEKETRKGIIKQERPGGFVMHPVKGHHKNIIEFDFKSLYPSLVISFNVGPETWMPPGNGDISAPFGTYYSRVESIIAGTLKDLVREREKVKGELSAAKSRGASKEERAALKGRTEALKILLNSFYGQLYAPFSPLFHFDSARNITTLGQECVKLMLAAVKEYGATAIAGDTDSTYIQVAPENFNEAFANDLSVKLTARVAAHLKEKYNVNFTGAFDFKGLFSDMSIYKMKRYAKLESGKPASDADVIGYERGDVYDIQLELQKKVFECQFTGSSIQGMLEEVHSKFKAERDHTQVLRWRRGHTSAEGRALDFLMEQNLPPIPGDSVGFLIIGKGTKKDPEHRIAARRLDSETIEWVDEKDGALIRGPSRSKTFLTDNEAEVLWQQIVENLDGVGA